MDNWEDTEKAVRNKAERYCSQAERCVWDVEQKLDLWGADDALRAKIIACLYDNGYLNDARYCHAFVHDKVRFAQWGRQKIRYALRAKRLPDTEIENALQDIDEEEYTQSLRRLASSHSVRGKDRNSLIRFLLQRGYTYEEISQKIAESLLLL